MDVYESDAEYRAVHKTNLEALKVYEIAALRKVRAQTLESEVARRLQLASELAPTEAAAELKFLRQAVFASDDLDEQQRQRLCDDIERMMRSRRAQ
jgi:hypothetical protein